MNVIDCKRTTPYPKAFERCHSSRKRDFFMQSVVGIFFVLSLLVAFTSFANPVLEGDTVATSEQTGKDKGVFIEYFNYGDYVYSKSKKTELGDQVEMDLAVRYQYNPDTFGRLRFETDPVENRFNNKTSNFEFLAGHRIDTWTFQIDSELKTNEENTGGTSIGFDIDSELTFASSWLTDQIQFTFYPFNFDGEVGREFNTWDVTRLYFFEGAPATITPGAPVGDEKIAMKTIPGFELAFEQQNQFRVYVGLGAATYLYPTNDDFDVTNQRAADRWERREDIGYKLGGWFRTPGHRLELKWVSHNKSQETGSLLESAGSIYSINELSLFTVEAEVTYSKAGTKPYRLNRAGTWFQEIAPYQPLYADRYDQPQNWLGKADTAYSLRLGYRLQDQTPYLALKHQGANFIFRDRESAHRLRTADENESHGGLNRVGVGSYIYKGDFVINPELEWLQAKNAVFSNSSDVRQDRYTGTFLKEDYLLFLTVSYEYGGNRTFRP